MVYTWENKTGRATHSMKKTEDPPMKNLKARLVILSAPSGCGKDTIAERICARMPGAGVAVSCTTRPPRPKKGTGEYEKEGVDYFFISEEEFLSRSAAGDFLETAYVKGTYYGTPLSHLRELDAQGKDLIILIIENLGMMQVKALDPSIPAIFIVPPSAGEVRRRLIERKSNETEAEINRRIEKGREQMKCGYIYDYVVLNDDLNQAAEDVYHILKAHELRTRYQKNLLDRVNETYEQQENL